MRIITPVAAVAMAGATAALVLAVLPPTTAGILFVAPAAAHRTARGADQHTISATAQHTISTEWTQWRGAAGDGVVSVENRAGEWPERAVLLWEQEVGDGYSGPVVAGDRVWVFTRRGDSEVVSSLSLTEGRIAWRRRYEVPFEQDPDARAHGSGPYATPAVADGRLFTLGMTSILSVWDARSGGLIWRRDYAEEFERNRAYFGTASSPVVWGDLCFVHFGGTWGEESDRGAMVALDVATGAERWRWEEDAPAIGATPVLAEIGGRLQLVFKSKENIVGVDPSSGTELWRIFYSVSQGNTIVTPLLIGDQLVTSDWDKGVHSWMIERGVGEGSTVGASAGGGAEGEAEIRADAGSGAEMEGWRARKLWQTRDASTYTSSPVLISGQVVGLSHFRRGQLFGMNPSNGQALWRGEGRAGEHASFVVWGEDLLVFSEDGSLAVGRVSPDGFRPLRTYDLGDSMMWAHPAVVGHRIIIKDGSRLAVYSFE